ncbi:MAG: sulfur-carrier protein adenylyltransferase/sulfurtransferase [Gaiellales bacterium]|nr:sulfur-carrier protein adenylyltransferase/sulfurtransferase [Gaiellales bacterium]
MAGYQDLLAEVKTQISEISAADAAARLSSDEPPVLIDVREPDEFDQGAIEGSVHIPRGFLESRIGGVVPDLATSIVITCQSGARSAFAARSLEELGYEDVTSLAGGFGGWKQSDLPWSTPKVLNEAQRVRYSRHTLIPEVGEAGQLKLLDSHVLLVGAGGLGSPAGLYLAAAGVGTIAIVDADVVDESNLQRQVLHSMSSIGMPKVDSAKQRIEELNPDVQVVTFRERLTSENIDRMLEGVDVIVDGTDNFPTRYLLNDASLRHRIPVVHASIFRFEGQLTVFKPYDGPCYRCLFPQPPPPELAPSCAEGGVLGVLPGIMGSLQASEALKLLLDIGEPPVGRLILFDALDTSFHEVRLRRDPDCPVCGADAGPIEYIDYEEFCLPPARATT